MKMAPEDKRLVETFMRAQAEGDPGAPFSENVLRGIKAVLESKELVSFSDYYAQWAPMFSRLMMVCHRLETGQPIKVEEVRGWGNDRPDFVKARAQSPEAGAFDKVWNMAVDECLGVIAGFCDGNERYNDCPTYAGAIENIRTLRREPQSRSPSDG